MNPSFKMMGASPVKQEKKGDEFGSIEKGQYPNLVEDISEVQKDDIGHFVTGLDDGTGPHYSSDTTRFPANFTTWKGPIKEGDLLDETAHEAWMGVDVETEGPDGSNPATGTRMMWDEKSGTYKPFKQKEAAKVMSKAALEGAKKLAPKAVEKEIERMLGGGATDSEIRKYVKSTGTGDKYEYNWDNVTQRVESHPLKQGVKRTGKFDAFMDREELSKKDIRRIKRKNKRNKSKDPEYNKPSEVEKRFGALPQKYDVETAHDIETAGGGKSDHITFTNKKGKSVDYQQHTDADGNVTTYKTKYSNKRGKDGSYQTKRKTISNKRGERQIRRKLNKS